MMMLIFFVLASIITGHSEDTVYGRECGFPGKPKNGTYEPVEKIFYPGDEVVYSCQPTFVLKGEETRICSQEGRWTGQLPLCKENIALYKTATQSDVLWSYGPELAVDGDPNNCSFTSRKEGQRWWQVSLNRHLSVESVRITLSPGSYQKFSIFVVEILDGSTAEYKPCAQWEGRFRNQRKELKCVNSGQRGQFVYIRDDRVDSEYFGLCEVEVFQEQDTTDCGSPEVPVSTELSTLSSGSAEYTCTAGFTFGTGSRAIINCTADGWVGNIPLCKEVSCDHPSSAKDGFIEVSNFRGNYVYGSRAKYHCNPGFILWGNSTRICDSTGTWTGLAPMCRPISCGEPPMLPGSAVTLINGSAQWKSVAQYSCLPGFVLLDSGNSVRQSTCQDTGAWSAVSFNCVTGALISNKPINTVWIKGSENSDNSPSYVTIALLSMLAAVISGISILAAFISFKRWMRKIQYHNQENIFVEKPLLESQQENNGVSQDPAQQQGAYLQPHKFSTFQLSPVSSLSTSSTKNSSGTDPNLTLSRLPNDMLRFKYADMEELMERTNVNMYDDRIQYANVNPRPLHYATLSRDLHPVYCRPPPANKLAVHYATLSRIPRKVEKACPVEPVVHQSESVPDILQTVSQLESAHAKPNIIVNELYSNTTKKLIDFEEEQTDGVAVPVLSLKQGSIEDSV